VAATAAAAVAAVIAGESLGLALVIQS
jgi:hypothetical protein